MPHTATLHKFQRRCEVLDSSTIKLLCFDPKSELLRVEFLNGSVYDYQGVSPRLFGSLCASYSVGQAFAKLIKNNYKGIQQNGNG